LWRVAHHEPEHVARKLNGRPIGASRRAVGEKICGLGLSRRLAIVLLELGAEFGVRDTRGTILGITVSQRMLAEMIGASRPKVSIAMTRLIREGMVLREHRQVVLIVQKLNDFVASPPLAEPLYS
jgi:hypothetical protein